MPQQEDSLSSPGSFISAFTTRIDLIIGLFNRIPHDIIALIARLSVGAVFWQSGQTKLDGWHISENAIELFRSEYRLPLVDPTVAATLAALAEHIFPILLFVGLASRAAAAALLIMTLIIEIFVYPDAWPIHGTWAACFLLVIARGPGLFSLDHFMPLWSRSSSQSAPSAPK
jgi:putative oxidoreductase